MNTQAPQHDQQQLLEERLKVHIKREFDLGEKVISLLKQKKTLETNLQEQLTTKEALEQKLEAILASKRAIEQKFSQIQRELREQQKALRRRSRRIIETEEGSREDLKLLREEIHQLKEQLEILDIQKVEEHVQLSNKIQELCDQESHLKQELQKISYQKEVVEEELNHTVEKFQELSGAHEREKTQYEQQIEVFQRKQSHLEIRIAHLLDEQKRNEHKLQQEIDTLKLSKAELEEKVEHLQHQPPEIVEQPDPELWQIIAQKEQSLRDLKEKAHQRSTRLRAENENLKKEVKSMLSAQEKITWENQMLESSLKGLQHDLAEYIQLKRKFEEAQKEKSHFEESFYQKIKFFEARGEETGIPQASSQMNQAPKEHDGPTQKVRLEPDKHPGNTVNPGQSGKNKKHGAFRKSWNKSYPKVLISAGMLIAIMILGIGIYSQFPSRGVPATGSKSMTGKLPEYKFELPEDQFELPTAEFKPSIAPEKKSVPGFSEGNSKKNNKMVDGTSPVQKKKQEIPKSGEREIVRPTRPIDIVVQLPTTRNDRFLPDASKPFPTIENNIVLRHHAEQKLSSVPK